MGYQNRKFHFVIPGKPPIKRRHRGKTHYTPKATVLDEQRVRDNFFQTYPEIRSSNRFSVEIKIYTDRKTVDGDNVEKAILDALSKVLWENDRQVRQMFWVIQSTSHWEAAQWGECVWITALELT